MLMGYINQATSLIGRVGNNKSITGKIDKPSGHTPVIDGDHQFITVDLVKMQEQIASVSSVTAIVPFTAENTQITGSRFYFNAVPTAVNVNSMTANNISFTALNTQTENSQFYLNAVPTNITVNEEVFTNANE